MESIPLGKDIDKKVVEHIFNNALGNPIVFKTQPTSENMKANTVGVYNNDIYIKNANGGCLKLTGTVVT